MRCVLFIVGLSAALIPVFAQDCEYVSFDPLPENAEELARAHVEEFLSQRYPEETIVIGEAIPLYVNDNDIRILDFILELDGSEPCTFEKELNIHTSYWENYDEFDAYTDSLSGDFEALRKTSLGEDEVYNNLNEQLHNLYFLRTSISHILIAFVSGEPRIIGTHSVNRFFVMYNNLSEFQMSNFIGFGFLASGCPGVFISVLVKDVLGNVEWLWNNEITIFEDAHPVCKDDPMTWSFFSKAFKARGKEDLPPVE